MEEENIAIRLKCFIQSQGLTNSQFADKCGIARPSLSQLLGGRNKKISDVLVGQIHNAYPELSVLWLMFGEGSMLVPEGPAGRSDSSSCPEIGRNGIFDDDSGLENPDFNITSRQDSSQSNLTALNTRQKSAKVLENQANDLEIKNAELTMQIEKMRKNPRKVTQITVYYDDSTFETFYPKR